MRKLMVGWIVLLGVGLLISPACGAQEGRVAITDFAWLVGCWKGQQGQAIREEYWTRAAGGEMFGIGRALRDEKIREFEFMRIHQTESEIFYTAKPSRQPEGSFKLILSTAGEVVFENPQHDFPQRITYRKTSDVALAVRVEGVINGNRRTVDFSFARVSCDATMSAK